MTSDEAFDLLGEVEATAIAPPPVWNADPELLGYAAVFAGLLRESYGENAPLAIADTLYGMTILGNLNPRGAIFLAMTLGMLCPACGSGQTVH